ncbi:hypothetical protein E4656_15445 [Natronospirillum operosum]|uniref:Outer membrane protein beta-barrel domain-containing protein n=1 Tax=Natronospirillum operosum TaxID=2759953 RepID=A0A4Z0WBA1_9GAMM|nr:outer membrane beta-barrel protein [Natronospirillum operosum]TGG91776.1 hypothetical protein E4656_15445 [Natronospirillum operosum]
MKKTLLPAAIALAALSAPVSAYTLSEGDNVVGGTVGFGFTTLNNALTFGAAYERGLIDDLFSDFNFAVGAQGTYTDYSGGLNYSLSHTFIGAQANLHYDNGDSELQPYGGLVLGYNNWSYGDDNISGSWGSGISSGLQVGTRYYFSEEFAANVRWNTSLGGWGTFSQLNVGVDYSF